MRVNSWLSAASSLLLASLVLADGDVISLTDSSFNSVVDPESLILVEFFAPW
jgi:protein disulfide-isomerase A1